VGDVDPDREIDQQAGEVARRTRAARAELHLGLVRARVSDELRQVVGREILAREQQQRRLGDQRHRRKIVRRVVERGFV
jgi:hypothetical protein